MKPLKKTLAWAVIGKTTGEVRRVFLKKPTKTNYSSAEDACTKWSISPYGREKEYYCGLCLKLTPVEIKEVPKNRHGKQ